MTRPGRVVIPRSGGFRPEPHEIDIARRLAMAGHEIEFLVPSNVPGVKTPDVLVDGETWELKSPIGSGRHTISHQVERGRRQSERIVLDATRTSIPDAEILAEISRRLSGS